MVRTTPTAAPAAPVATGDQGRRWILHVDLDQFVAAVEVLRRPELTGRPVVVGGSADPTRRRVVVATASYEARAYGVHSGMPLRTAARLCPDAVFLATDHAACEVASQQVMATLREFGPVEVIGWDEAFVGVLGDRPESVAADIRATVPARTGLTCAVGIGDNKHRAKLATGFAKRGKGIDRLTSDTWAADMFARPTTALWGIGPRMARNLAELGIDTVGQLATADEAALVERFGPTMGRRYRALGRGAGDTELVTAPPEAKSRGTEVTLPDDLTDWAEITDRVVALARERANDAATQRRVVARVEVKLRFVPFFTVIRSRVLPEPSSDTDAVIAAVRVALGRFDDARPVRLIGVRVVFADS